MDINKSENTKKKILNAALKCFSKKGYSATSTKEIAKTAGVAEGLVFTYFKTKKNLYETLINPFLYSLLPSDLDETIKKQDVVKNFNEFLSSFYKDRYIYFLDNFENLKLLFTEIMFNEKKRKEFLKIILNKELNPLFNILFNYQENNEINPNVKIKKIVIDIISLFFTSLIKEKIFYNKKNISVKEIEREIEEMVYKIDLMYGQRRENNDRN